MFSLGMTRRSYCFGKKNNLLEKIQEIDVKSSLGKVSEFSLLIIPEQGGSIDLKFPVINFPIGAE